MLDFGHQHKIEDGESASSMRSSQSGISRDVMRNSQRNPQCHTQNGAQHSSQKGAHFAVDANDASNIRIVIRDVEPPLWAQLMRAFMHVICGALLLAVLALGVPQFLGIREFNVMTGSMTPTYPVGTLVFTVPCDPAEIQVGDVVTCVMNENLDVITHRVVANDIAAGTITTRGDANNNDDAPTLYANVLGVVRFSVPMLGGLIDYFTGSLPGRMSGLVILACVVVLTLLAESICSQLSSQTAEIYEED